MAREARALVVAAVSAIMLITVISLAAIPYSQTVRQNTPPDILWRSGLWQQVTGFLLLGFSFIGLSLYFRNVKDRNPGNPDGMRLRRPVRTQRSEAIAPARGIFP